jgi:FkbM family methyltransferase
MVNENLKHILRKLLPAGAYRKLVEWKIDLCDDWARSSYAQEGEDLILLDLLADVPTGFYVDVGAFHPEHYSNTRLFHRRGWRGINIDPNPAAAAQFRRKRPRDINLNVAVTREAGTLQYFMFETMPSLNTCDAAVAEHRRAAEGLAFTTVAVEGLPLAALLDRHLPAGQDIHFLSIDVEGLELDVLRSNDWERRRPRYVLTESLNRDLAEVLEEEATRFLVERGYVPFARTPRTVFFRDGRAPRGPSLP